MSDYTSKISELNSLVTGNLAGEIPLSLTLSSGTLATNKITLSQLRDLFDFDSAYSTVEEGIAATVENQMFYVYVDNNKLSVNEYVRTNIGANAVIGKSGTKKIIYIPALLKHVKVQVDSFAALREFKPWWEGQVVYLKGYYEGSSLGEGEFYYDYSKRDFDNNVTVCNGWVKLNQKTLSNEDIGLSGKENADVSDQLQVLMRALEDGYTLKLRGYFITSKPIKIEGIKNLTVDGSGATISSKEVRESYQVLDYASTNTAVLMTGLLSCFNCKNINLKGLNLQGCVKMSTTFNVDKTVIGEEHGLFLRSCDGGVVSECEISNVFGYGCLGWFQSNMEFHHNYVHDILRESGVNLISGGSYGKVYANTFKNIGLYGVEVEGHPYLGPMSFVEVWGNTIEDCRFGITVVDQCLNANIFNNTIKRCHTGLSSYRTYNYSVESILFSGNDVHGCIRGAFSNTAKNTSFHSNVLDVEGISEFIYTSSFNNIIEVDRTNRAIFWAPYNSEFSSLTGKQISISGQTYTIVSSVWDSTKTSYGKDLSTDPDGLLKVTLDVTLPNFPTNAVLLAKTKNWNSTLGYQSNGYQYSCYFKENIVRGYDTGLYLASSIDSSNTKKQEIVVNNLVEDCGVWLLGNSSNGFREISNNQYSSGSDIVVGSWVKGFWDDVKMANKVVMVHPPRTSTNTLLKIPFYSEKNLKAVGVRIYLLGWSSTGTIQVNLNGAVVVGSGTYTSGDETLISLYTKMNVIAGVNVLQLNSSNNTLLYSYCNVELLIP